MRDQRARLLLAAFAAAALVDLGSLAAGFDPGHLVAKPLLIPLLAAWAALLGAPRLLLAALLCGWGGDVLLMADADAAFLAGMAFFAAGHGCYIALFRRAGASRADASPAGTGPAGTGPAGASRSRARAALLVRLYAVPLYAVVLVALVVALWPGLPAGLRLPVAGYSALLTAMACTAALRLGVVAGAGGALFMLSDTLIATALADWPQPPHPDVWIMLTYIAAQYLLARGTLGARATAPTAYGEVRSATL